MADVFRSTTFARPVFTGERRLVLGSSLRKSPSDIYHMT